MKRLLLLLILLSSLAVAQIDQSVLDKQADVCGNGVRERFELCDDPKGRDAGLCTEAGKILRIVMVCNPQTCGCIPYKNKDCGNNVLEGSEFCDPPAGDKCADLGQLIGTSLECNPKTCMCTPAKDVAVGPGVSSETTQENKTEEKCGNRELDAGEKCDPPGRTCYYEDKGERKQGLCSDTCACDKLPEAEQSTPPPTAPAAPPSEPVTSPPAETPPPAPAQQTQRSPLRIVLGLIILAAVGFLVYTFTKKQQRHSDNPLDEMEQTEKDEREF
ncbi:hypothetical protein HY490_02785 [Candidatus Woesearchaeota archaeon]|nr:hypothetical protein [Candidatus Woesearchaeota archaeon]